MKTLKFTAVICLLLCSFYKSKAQLIITEIMQNPSCVNDSQGEWFELFNASEDSIDIRNWSISDNGSNNHSINDTSAILIAPGTYFVLGNNLDQNTNGGYICNYEYSGFTLSNGADEIILKDSSGNLIDSVAYDGGTQFPDPNGASMVLTSCVSDDNNLGPNWMESTIRTESFDSICTDFGSPGSLGNFQNQMSYPMLSYNELICDNETFSAKVLNEYDTVLWFYDSLLNIQIGAGDSILIPNNPQGIRTIWLMVRDSNCELITNVSYSVSNSFDTTIFRHACDSFLSPNSGIFLTSSGLFSDTLLNSNGCDSVISLNLDIFPSFFSALQDTVCDQYFSPFGMTFNQSGIYYDSLISSKGCDSITAYDVLINNSEYDSLDVSTCGLYTSPSGNYTWSSSGIYMDTLQSTLGCDSILIIDLNVNQTSFNSYYDTACIEYLFSNGQILKQSGIYYDTMVGSLECDSIIELNLTILDTDSSHIVDSVCFSYLSPDGTELWTSSGLYIDTVINSKGCDSVIYLDLTILDLDSFAYISGDTLLAFQKDVNYQWYDCISGNAIPGESQQYFIPAESGQYSVLVDNGICNGMSECLEFIIENLQNLELDQFEIFPVPFQDKLIVKNTDHEEFEIRLFNINGKTILKRRAKGEMMIETNSLSKGIYVLDIRNESIREMRRIIKD